MTLTIGTRASSLAVAQTEILAESLRAALPDLAISLRKITTRGDQILDRSLADIGGKGLFVKEIEQALLDGEIDCAVHSLKDMPVEPPAGLDLVCFPQRESPFDTLCNRGSTPREVAALPHGARVGTGSQRRGLQLLEARPDLEIVPLRGSIETRLAKRETMNLDAVVLAESGLQRAQIWEDGFVRIEPGVCVPAPGQGALCVQIRADDPKTRATVMTIHSPDTHVAITAERACLEAIGGDCHTPFAAWAQFSEDAIHLRARLYANGRWATQSGSTAFADGDRIETARTLGARLGRALLEELGLPPLESR